MSTPPVVPVISTRATPTEIRTAFERLRSYYVGVQREGGSVTVQDLINARIARFNKLGILVSDDFFEVPEGAGLTDEQLKLIEDMDKIVRGIAEDGVFSIVEKAQWKATWDNLGREAVGIQDQCIFLGLAVEIHKAEAHVDNSTVYNNWITKGLELVAYMLSPTGANWDDMTVNTDINAERFAEVWDDYFLTKQILLNTITSTIASEAALTVEQIAALLALDELIEGITEDGLFSSIEKLQWKATWDNLVTEATGITEQCVTIGLTTEGTKGNATSPSNVVEYNSWLSTGVTLYNYMLAPAPAGADWSVLTENTAIEKDVFDRFCLTRLRLQSA